MGAYRYEAVDAAGRTRRGLIEGETSREVRDRLQGDGLFPTSIDAVDAVDASGAAGGGEARERLSLPRVVVALATRQLATLARSGMPLDQALAAVGEQADDARAKRLFGAQRRGPSTISTAASSPSARKRAGWPRCSSASPTTSRRARC